MDEQKLWSVRFWTLAAALILAFAVLMFALSHRNRFVRESRQMLTGQTDSSVDTATGVNGDAGADAVGVVGPVTNVPIVADLPATVEYQPPPPTTHGSGVGADNILSLLPPLPGAVPMPSAG